MSATPVRRSVTVERAAPGRFSATNERGGTIRIGTGDDEDLTPTELLRAAIVSRTVQLGTPVTTRIA